MDANRAVWKRAAIVACVAVGVTFLSRLPLVLSNPDWGPTVSEHCHVLSSPVIHAQRSALEGQESNPYWLVNPEQMRQHYHGGSACVSYAVWGLSRVLGSRTLLPLKVLGLVCTLVYTLCMALILALIAVPGRDRGLLWVPILLGAFPPVFFLWVTLVPLGHYYESHLFYALFMPPALLAAEGRLNALSAAVVGVVGGLSVAYTLSNVVFVGLVLIMLWLSGSPGLRARFVHSGLLVAGCAVVLSFTGTLQRGWGRLADSLGTLLPGSSPVASGVGEGVDHLPWTDLVVEHASLLLGRHGQVGQLQPGEWATGVLLVVSGLLAVTAAGPLLVCVFRAVRPKGRGKLDRSGRFLAANGLLLAAFAGAYLLVDPYTHHGGSARIEYLIPIFPPLFVGAGALLDRALLSRRRPLVFAALFVAILSAGVSIQGWAVEVADNARSIHRPPVGGCDARHVHGFFWEVPAGPRAAGSSLGWPELLDREGGEQRCSQARPGEEQSCAFTGYVLEALALHDEATCDDLPWDRAVECVRAHSSVELAIDACTALQAPPPEACEALEPTLRRACVSGAYQGNSLDGSTYRCQLAFIGLCGETFSEPRDLAACAEQSAALLLGMPALEPAPQTVPGPCLDWPEPWRGLCARAAVGNGDGAPAAGVPSCEEVYLDRFAQEVPQELPYSQCLFNTVSHYPYCAVGIARARGEVDCRWTGELESRGP